MVLPRGVAPRPWALANPFQVTPGETEWRAPAHQGDSRSDWRSAFAQCAELTTDAAAAIAEAGVDAANHFAYERI